MTKIYKSLSAKYTNKQIEMLSGTVCYVSFGRMLKQSIEDCVGLKEDEIIVGLEIDSNGIKCYIEKIK